MLVSDALATPRSLLDDPSKLGWSDPDLIAYLNTFMLDLSGIRRDIYSQRVVMNLVAGTYQTLPAGGIEFLDSYFAANGQAVLTLNIADIQNSQFAATSVAAPSVNPKIVTSDPRDRKGFRVFPAVPNPPTGATLDFLYAATPPLVTALGDTYPLDPDTLGGANSYVLGMAFDKNTERRDTVKSAYYMKRYMDWAQGNLQAQMMDAPVNP